MASGLTSAQRRVLAALGALKVNVSACSGASSAELAARMQLACKSSAMEDAFPPAGSQITHAGAAPSLPFPPFSHRSSPTTTSSTPQVSPSKVAVNTEFLDIFQINVAERMRLKSSNQLRQTAILIRDPLRQLLRWREALARRINRPRAWIFDNALATSLVETPPADTEALSSRMRGQRSFPKRELLPLFELLASPLTDEELELPPIPPPIRGEPAQLLAQVRDKVAARATELDLPPALLCPRRLLEAWVRGGQSPELAGWRGQALGDLLDR